MLFALLCLCFCSIPSYSSSNCSVSHITQLNPPKNPTNADHTYRIVQVIAPKTCVRIIPPEWRPPHRRGARKSSVRTCCPRGPAQVSWASPTTLSERGFHLWVGRSEALHYSSIFVHYFPTYFHVFPNMSKLSRCFCRISMAWRCLTHHLLAALSNQNLSHPPKKKWWSSMSIIMFHHFLN